MIRVAGIDVSSRAVDIVTIPLDPEQPGVPYWDRHEFVGTSAIERAALAPSVIPRGVFWDNVAEVAIERPYGPGGDTLFALHLMVGAVVAALPARLRPPLFLHPSQWRKAAGLSGNASKEMVVLSSAGLFARPDAPWNATCGELHETYRHWPQDAHDAHLIALAARNLNLERLTRAA